MAHKRVTIPAAIVAAYKSGELLIEYPHLKAKFDAAVKTKEPKLTLDTETAIQLLDTFREGKLYETAKEAIEGFLLEGSLDPAEKAVAEALLQTSEVLASETREYTPDVKVLSSTTWEMYNGEYKAAPVTPRYLGTRQARRLASRLANRVGMTQYDLGRRVRKVVERAQKRVEAGRWAGVGDPKRKVACGIAFNG